MNRASWLALIILAGATVWTFVWVHEMPQENPVGLFLAREGMDRYEAFREEFRERPVILGRLRGATPDLRARAMAEVLQRAAKASSDVINATTLPAPKSDQRPSLVLEGNDFDAFVITCPYDSKPRDTHVLIDDLLELEDPDRGLHVDLAGVAFTNRELDRASAVIGQHLFPLIFLLGLVLVFGLTRRLRSTFAIYPPALLATAATLAGIRLTFGSMDMVTSIVPLLSFVLNLSLAFHLTCATETTGSFRRAWAEKARPILLMVTTTGVGFGALALSGIPAIQRFGAIAGVSVVLTAGLTALWVYLASRAWIAHDVPPRSEWLARAVAWRAPKSLVATAIVVCLGGGAFEVRTMRVETDALEFFSEASGIADRIRDLQRDVVGTPVVEVLATPPDSLSDSDALAVVDRLERALASRFDGTSRLLSRASLLRNVALRLTGSESLPNSPATTTVFWRLLPASLQLAYTPRARERITMFGENRGAEEHREQLEAIEEAARLLEPGGWLYVSTINRTWRAKWLAVHLCEAVGWIPKGTHDARMFVRPAELSAMGEAAGLRVEHWAGEAPAVWSTLRAGAIELQKSRSTAVAYSSFLRKVSL